MNITGILSISNGTGLAYPYKVVVHNLMRLCDNVIVGVDPEFPLDRESLESLGLEAYGLQLVDAPWNRDNRCGGTEIALQMDSLVRLAKTQHSDWVVVMQADELLHDGDFSMLRSFMGRAEDSTTGFSTERMYFWKNLSTVRTDWNAKMVRIFRGCLIIEFTRIPFTLLSNRISPPVQVNTELNITKPLGAFILTKRFYCRFIFLRRT